MIICNYSPTTSDEVHRWLCIGCYKQMTTQWANGNQNHISQQKMKLDPAGVSLGLHVLDSIWPWTWWLSRWCPAGTDSRSGHQGAPTVQSLAQRYRSLQLLLQRLKRSYSFSLWFVNTSIVGELLTHTGMMRLGSLNILDKQIWLWGSLFLTV